MAYAPPKDFPCLELSGISPPADLTRLQASDLAFPLWPYLHRASSELSFGMHFGSRFGSQFFLSASSSAFMKASISRALVTAGAETSAVAAPPTKSVCRKSRRPFADVVAAAGVMGTTGTTAAT